MTKQEIEEIKAEAEALAEYNGDCRTICVTAKEAVFLFKAIKYIPALIAEVERVQHRSEHLQKQVPALKKYIEELEGKLNNKS